jgi:membrane protease YdiL (CAAX protease family)
LSWRDGLAGALRLPPRDPGRESLFEFRRAGPCPVWLQVLLVIGVFVANVLLTHAEYRAHGTAFGYPGPATTMLVVYIYEELAFRGWILGQLERRLPAWAAIAASSLLFGLWHLRNIPWLEPARLAGLMAYTGLVIGPLLGWVTLRFRSLWPAAILHGLHNLARYL